MTRRVSELIRLAQTTAQTHNTDALSWRDKIDFLNQSYERLYEDINESGDLYYSKEMELNGNEDRFTLPKDFGKLLFIGYRLGKNEIPIQRSPNSIQFGYKIINNELFISDRRQGQLVIKYIPKAQYITFPRKGELIDSKAEAGAYDSINDVIVLKDNSLLSVIQRKTGQIKTLEITEIVEVNEETIEQFIPFVLAISGGIIYTVRENSIVCYDYDLNQISEQPIIGGTYDLYAHSIGWEPGIIISIAGEPHKYMLGGEPTPSIDYWNYMNSIIKKDGDNFFYIMGEGEEPEDITDLFRDADSFVIADPYIYINKNGSVEIYENFEKIDIAPAIVGGGAIKGKVLGAEANNESGFGVLFLDNYSRLNLLGFANDTVMDYPQQLFFDYMIIDLAIKFRIALDIPTGELPAMLDDYYDTLMRSISRDSFQKQRINNVYLNSR